MVFPRIIVTRLTMYDSSMKNATVVEILTTLLPLTHVLHGLMKAIHLELKHNYLMAH